MQNTYIIDVFLSAWAWVVLALLYPSVVNHTQKLNAGMDKQLFRAVFSMVFKSSIWLACPFVLVFLFLLWRFGSLMHYTQTLGIGGIGLLIIMGIAGIALIWLKALLVLMTNGLLSPKAEDKPKIKTPRYDEYGREI